MAKSANARLAARATARSCTIRPASAADAAALTALLNATFIETWAPQMSDEALAAWRLRDSPARYVREKSAAFFVAEADGELAGMIHWHEGFVHALHVDAGHRRCGIGATLMAMAERASRAAGHEHLRLETDTFNTGSRALYARLGFREVERYPDQEYDAKIVTLLLEKDLQR
jgi:ribosomal protein S18 acetylase RimI-like enzyme